MAQINVLRQVELSSNSSFFFIVSGSISVVKTCKSNKASIVILPYKIAILKNAKAGYRDPENTEIQKMVKIILLILRNYQ